MRIRLMFVGKLKEKFAEDGYEHYRKKLSRFFKLDEVQLRDAPAKLPAADKKKHEGQAILAALKPNDFLVIMDETGKEYPSRDLAKMVTRWAEDRTSTPCFLIGGPFGLSDAVKKRANASIRFGSMTWPHELCRVMLLEQLYRSGCIRKNIPYHHD